MIFGNFTALSEESNFIKEYKLLERADKLYLYSKYVKAIDLYNEILKHTENEIIKIRASFKLGKAYYFQRKFQKSEKYLRQVIESNIKFKDIVKGSRLFLAGIEERKGNYANAINMLIPLGQKRDYYSFLANRKINRIISENPEKNLKKNYGLIDFYIVQRDYERALEIIDLFLSEKPTEELLYLKAKLLFNKGKYGEALKLFDSIIKSYPKGKHLNNAYYYKATIYAYQNKLDDALSILNSLSLTPNIMLKRAYIYGKKGQKDKKIQEYKNFLKKFPVSFQVTYVLFNLGQIYESDNDIKSAIYYYRYLIDKYPMSRLADDVIYRLIALYKKIKDEEKIKSLKKKLIENYPLSVYTYYINGYKLFINKEFDLSMDTFLKDEREEEELGKIKDVILLFKNKMFENAYYEAKNLYNLGNRELILVYLLAITSEKIGKYYDSMKFREMLYYYMKQKEYGISLDLVKFVYPKFYKNIVEEKAKKYKVDPLLIYAILREESRFGKYALSSSYAIGLMQIIPSTGKWISSKLNIKDFDPVMLFNPIINIEFGTWYVSYLNKLFSGNIDAILASYNGGPGNGKKWFKDIENKDRMEIIENNISYPESKEYVKKCLSSYYTYKNLDLYTNKNNPN